MATDYYRLRVQGIHQTEYNECVMHFQGDNLVVADYMPNAADLLQAFNDNVLAAWLDMMPASYQVLRLSASKASAGGGGEQQTQYQYGSQPGTVSGGAASQQLCPCVTLIPPLGTKSAGKIYLPCIAESQIQANAVNSTWLSNLAALMGIMLSSFSTSAILWQLAIHSRVNANFRLAADYSVSPIVGFQRRRQRSPL